MSRARVRRAWTNSLDSAGEEAHGAAQGRKRHTSLETPVQGGQPFLELDRCCDDAPQIAGEKGCAMDLPASLKGEHTAVAEACAIALLSTASK
jgi:hypothetical protein